ncbi:MAG: Peptidase family protein [Patescibacteria group bacterium]|nr:Peptidase family protein [Patescibacteria group bacterium]
MKQYYDYKKQFNFLLLGLILVLPVFFYFNFSFAQTAQELQNKIEQKNTDIDKLEQQIKTFQNQLGELSKQKDSLSNTLKQLDLTKKKLSADISLTQSKIDKTNLKIQSLSSDISNKEESISDHTGAIGVGIRRIAEFEDMSMVGNLISKESDFTTVWNDIDNINTLRESIRDQISTLKVVKGELEDTRDETIEAKKELVSLRTDLADQKKIVDNNVAEKNKLLKDTKNNEANYQKIIKDQTAKKLALEQEIKSYESQLKFILDPSKLPTAGVLSWPLDEIFVTQQFGVKTGPHRIYANGHSGTDFRARTPQKLYAMADGTVMGTGNTDITCPGASFGQWILIEYGNGLASTYGHLSLIKVSKGQKVVRGELIGYTGSTGRVTGPHLHLSVYASTSVKVETLPSKSCPGKTLTQPIAATNGYLDPMFYLPPYAI